MKYGTLFSGIEAPSVAWKELGWEAQWFSEIDPFACEVLKTNFPNIKNLGDVKDVVWNETAPVDLLIAGSPCQSFSVAGKQEGLDSDNGQLAYEFIKALRVQKPRWFIYENVPGILSNDRGRAFGTLIGEMAKLGYYVSYRVLDAKHWLPQRRKRVFVVGHSGDWRYPPAVLFERSCLQGGIRESAQEKDKNAKITVPSVTSSGPPYSRTGNERVEVDALLLTNAEGSDGATLTRSNVGKSLNNQTPLLVFHPRQDPISSYGETPPCETKGPHAFMDGLRVRRFTPNEVEKLQGFSGTHTLIDWKNKGKDNCPDTLRYKAIGNSMAVPVVRWLGERIQLVEEVGSCLN